MLKLFYRPKRIDVKDTCLFIDNSVRNIGKVAELNTVFAFVHSIPEIKVFENNRLLRIYRIDTTLDNPSLAGQFLHCSIRILSNSAVMIDGVISKNSKTYPVWIEADYEAIRLQPFFLSNAENLNVKLVGKGLFERGLHFSGSVTPASVRCVCICEKCNHSFSLKHFHAGFSEAQYFYSTNSKETLLVPYGAIANMPTQLHNNIDTLQLTLIESELPRSIDGSFRYYNSFKCPNCLAAFIDFKKYPEIRAGEYYGNVLLNDKVRQWTKNGS